MQPIRTIKICFFVLLLWLLDVGPALAQQYQYQEQKGKELTTVSVSRDKQGGLMRSEIVKNGVRTVCFSSLDGVGATSRWELTEGSVKNYAASREQNILTITGKTNGKPLENAAGLDDQPWLQDLGYSLAKFVKTPYRDLSFWTIQEGGLEPVVLTARKRGAETIALAGESVVTQKLEVRSNDFFMKLWTAFYWFRDSDGLLVKYQSDPGIPGMSVTIGTLATTPSKQEN